MVVCIILYIVLLVSRLWKRKKKIFLLLFLTNTVALILFLTGVFNENSIDVLWRNTYGEGDRTETYRVSVEGELQEEEIEILVGEREYSDEEIEEIFQDVIKKLDAIVRDEYEQNLDLPQKLDGYPVRIQWEFDNYSVLDSEGRIQEEHVPSEGTDVEVRGTISYKSKETSYVKSVKIYPKTKTEKEIWLDLVENEVEETEKETKKDKNFQLPTSIAGKKLEWTKKRDLRGYYVLLLGVVLSGLFIWKEKQDKKEQEKKNRDQMLRVYPDIVNQFTLLLSTGMTIKNVWGKIVSSYEEHRESRGYEMAYEEMGVTYREIQSGVSEKEAYEKFGKRCGVAPYMKFGALLAQNTKKGNKGLADILKMEAIQAFENRKSVAKQKGEEASTKLLFPMFGMLAVVMVIVIIPAFLSIQI